MRLTTLHRTCSLVSVPVGFPQQTNWVLKANHWLPQSHADVHTLRCAGTEQLFLGVARALGQKVCSGTALYCAHVPVLVAPTRPLFNLQDATRAVSQCFKMDCLMKGWQYCCWLVPKVYVGKAKRKVLDCLELTPEDRALLTDDANDSQIHVVPMAQVEFPATYHPAGGGL